MLKVFPEMVSETKRTIDGAEHEFLKISMRALCMD
jgi:hypothetical protein